MKNKDRSKNEPALKSEELLHRVKQFEAKYDQMEKILKETQSRYDALLIVLFLVFMFMT